jgi:hypothetical protein
MISVNDIGTEDVLMELADALEGAIVDASDRESHYQHLAAILDSNIATPQLIKLLHIAEARMRDLSTLRVIDFVAVDRTVDREIASKLRSFALRARRYVYHGTVFGRLASIAEHGLTPAMRPISRRALKVRNHRNGAVSFTTTWRGAVWWADATHRHSPGPRASPSRRPVVVRVPTDGLALECDNLAAAPNCIFVRGIVSMASADVLTELAGYPKWQPLYTVLGQPARR